MPYSGYKAVILSERSETKKSGLKGNSFRITRKLIQSFQPKYVFDKGLSLDVCLSVIIRLKIVKSRMFKAKCYRLDEHNENIDCGQK